MGTIAELPAADGSRARSLAREGRYLEATDVGARVLAKAPDAALAYELVEWRHKAFAELVPAPRRDWPPEGKDPAPGLLDAIPELPAAHLTPESLSGALAAHGSLIVRGLIEEHTAERLARRIDDVIADRVAQREGSAGAGDYVVCEAITDTRLLGARDWAHAGAVLLVDAPSLLQEWLTLLRASAVYTAVAGHLGERPALSANKTTLYRAPAGLPGQWHQDGAFLGRDVRTVNVWTALTHCGEDAPGLDIIPWRLGDIVPGGTHGSPFDWAVGHGKVEELCAGRPYSTPVFAPGDAILFDQMCLHNTGSGPHMTKTRYSIESWMFAPTNYPDAAAVVI